MIFMAGCSPNPLNRFLTLDEHGLGFISDKNKPTGYILILFKDGCVEIICSELEKDSPGIWKNREWLHSSWAIDSQKRLRITSGDGARRWFHIEQQKGILVLTEEIPEGGLVLYEEKKEANHAPEPTRLTAGCSMFLHASEASFFARSRAAHLYRSAKDERGT
ncbi:hypothetical protein [Termitidicoccus mucosus]|uniref:hypothetical protein n=1 Tax=Termitidicoccus mucosus TaxID=1184151 RepID=UPI002FEDEA16